MTTLSKYCSYEEAIRSDTASRLGIPNIPNEEQLEAMRQVATNIFDKVREQFGPLHVNSFFRSPALNNSTPGASKTSQHQKGEAIDQSIPGKNKEIFYWIIANLYFDQIIWEFGTTQEPAWVHCSYVGYRANRGEMLRAFVDQDNNIRYIPFDL